MEPVRYLQTTSRCEVGITVDRCQQVDGDREQFSEISGASQELSKGLWRELLTACLAEQFTSPDSGCLN